MTLDWHKISTYSLLDRPSKVNAADFGRPLTGRETVGEFIAALPNILGGQELREIINTACHAVDSRRLMLLAMGAHVIKVGLAPMLIPLIERRIIQGIAMNGAGIIHDFETAFAGKTSEDVSEVLGQGTFGMAAETGQLLNQAIREGARNGWGLGYAIGRFITEEQLPFLDKSLVAACYRHQIPLTVHVALGTDIIHMHPDCDGAAVGSTSMTDFRTFCELVAKLDQGIYFNVGSAVILPEVFLKALSLVRNLGHQVSGLTTVAIDFIRQYRVQENVVKRPTQNGGRGYYLTGQHEILLPLLIAGILARLEQQQAISHQRKE
ncbi:MAG: hypothetical protein JXO49_10060 [Deltaproteobacteria bacterium]|nr:hypothetical protein [Candidatus Anaeroferrophillus wilburensis]MBN2889676.1 hypothetical protein [Deltaproteobacteria bacterium]